MIFLELFYTFFIIGLFGFGGGYGMLSLIQTETVIHHQWLSSAEFTNIVAISQMTPGPIGINAATYCGYTATHNAGFNTWMAMLGSATATFALVLPSLILMIRRLAPCRCGAACRCRPALNDRRKLLFALHQPMAVWH